MLNCAI